MSFCLEQCFFSFFLYWISVRKIIVAPAGPVFDNLIHFTTLYVKKSDNHFRITFHPIQAFRNCTWSQSLHFIAEADNKCIKICLSTIVFICCSYLSAISKEIVVQKPHFLRSLKCGADAGMQKNVLYDTFNCTALVTIVKLCSDLKT